MPHALPIYSNVVALFPPTRPLPPMRHVTLLRLSGEVFATAGFLPGLASAPWSWIAETVAAELGVEEDQVHCEEAGEDESGGDFVTVDGMRVYQIAIGRAARGAVPEAGACGFDLPSS